MKEVLNKSNTPIRIPLPGGKKLFVGPGKIAQITDKAAESAAVQRLVEAGSIEILGEGERAEGISRSGTSPAQTYGHGKSPFRRRSGER